MDATRHSKMADGAAAIRAFHWLSFGRDGVCVDPYAHQLTSPAWRLAISNPVSRWLVTKIVFSRVAHLMGVALGRSRYTDDRIKHAIDEGIRQIVILGAGMDSLFLRLDNSVGPLSVFEVDHPNTQAVKRARLAALGVEVPTHVRFVPVDFERDDLEGSLLEHGLDRSSRVFFSWLGVSFYLSVEAITETLSAIRRCSGKGAWVVLDYMDEEAFAEPRARAVEDFIRFAARRGERVVTGFSRETLATLLRAANFEIVDSLSPAEQNERYWDKRRYGVRATDCFHFATLRST